MADTTVRWKCPCGASTEHRCPLNWPPIAAPVQTGQPRVPLDDLTSDALDALHARLELLENGARERSAILEEARDALEAAGINEAHGGESWPRLVPAIEELAAERDRAQRSATFHTDAHRRADARATALAAEVHRLTAGQCTHTRGMCEQHHAVPVAGCPYPRCRAATATGRAATA
ncbi:MULTISPECIES: hypothetical protein [unclassified Streptomyces]|uniref:hypothetical protein n=1 Tax=unclassified Streptomyces TaxID=2593676 RepID=UPI0009790287|nr:MULTISPECIES: hypothetical protein [unclassified Streptomyces]ONI48652.1 hypothetical protein STIB_72060 [Streptomyces sp. IB2014 011-1]RDV48186.1 hypothetical protein DDV98_28875 [Streptomyces sp. IB2014 011-12]